MAKRLQDLLNQDQNNDWISMAELDALEAAQRGQPIGQIPGSFGPGQGSFQRSGGNRVDLTPQGWQDTQTNEMMGPTSDRPNQDLPLDYANPLDYGGAKGYRIKGDSSRALLNDGRIVDLVPGRQESMQRNQYAQQQAQAKREAAQLDMDLKRATLAEKQGGGWKYNAELGMMINDRGETKPMSAIPGVSANRTREAQEAIDITEEAKKYVGQAPGSYIGAAGNIIGRAFGADTDASKAQAKLGVLGGALISKMPKMSGPQSDKDVALYKQMAGNLDDPTMPQSAKLAAIETIQMLNQKYAGADYKPAGAQSGPKQVASDADYNALPKGATYIDPNGNTRTKR